MTIWQIILSWIGLYKPEPPATWKDDSTWQDEEKYVSL